MPPTSTYRLQLRREFGFDAAAAVVPYLARLGVSHVYCSPVLEAVPGSAHGYDVVDHARLSTDLGGDAGWQRLVAACREHHLGVVLDVVPNHMAVPAPESLNGALWDVLRHGRASAYAGWFDIDREVEDGRLLMPVLGAPLDECLAAGDIGVNRDRGEVAYFEHRFPLAPQTPTGDVAAVLAAQHYRLAHWRDGNERLNYRRFFDVTSLIGVRVEDPGVFDATHERIAGLLADGDVEALRIDHPDGLADPEGYLDRLVEVMGERWVVVEKILEPGETLPRSWRCAGTTGYDALRLVTHVLLDAAGEGPLTELYAEVTGEPADFDTVVETSKRLVLRTLFPAEIRRLLRELGADDADTANAVVELLAGFDVYRAYPGDDDSRRRVGEARARAVARAPQLREQLDRLVTVLLADEEPTRGFAVRFAQTTGPVMAKGVEDTAFYRYHRLVALNEVGGSPGEFGIDVETWHAECQRLARDWPATMTTLSTHDTKRSEDVRARLLVLAEIPGEWRQAVQRWRQRARRHGPPDANLDYLFWQTVVGCWPIDADRIHRYVEKAAREAKQHTSWTDPDTDYEKHLHAYVDGVLADGDLTRDVAEWTAANISGPGEVNTLSQKLLQLTMPGVPDVYQGQELTGRFLVDPDNRQPVDYQLRRDVVDRLDTGHDGADQEDIDAKLLVTAAALRLRRDRPESFTSAYRPLDVTGPAAGHAIAHLRGDDVAVVVTRLPVGLGRRGGWQDTAVALPAGSWRDVLTGRPAEVALQALLADLPVALMTRDEG